MNKSKKNYQRKIKTRNIDFYLHEEDLYKFSKTINFSKFVKACLQKEMALSERKELDDDVIDTLGEVERLVLEGKLK